MEPDVRLMEFRCVEFVEELMYGEWRRKPTPPVGPLTAGKSRFPDVPAGVATTLEIRRPER